MKPLSIFSWLMMGFAVILVPVALFGSLVTWKLGTLQEITHSAAFTDATIRQSTERLLEAVHTQTGFERKYFVSGDADFLRQFESLRAEVETEFDLLMPLAAEAGLGGSVHRAEEFYRLYQRAVERELQLRESSDNYPRERFASIKNELMEELASQLVKIEQGATSARDEKLAAGNRLSLFLYRLTAVTLPVLMVVGGIIAIAVTRAVHRPVMRLRNRLREFGGGTFRPLTDIGAPAEIAELAGDFNEMGEKLMELDRMKADFLSRVSHELRTPLASISESAALLKEGVVRQIPGKEDELLDIVHRESRRLTESVNRLLNLSRMEAGMMEFDFREGDIVKVLDSVVQSLIPLAERRSIDLFVRADAGLPAVRMDEAQVALVVRNLVGNALRFTPEGGRISVEAEQERYGTRSVRIRVADTGCGIPTESLNRIFEKYSIAHGKRRNGSKTGLGLAIARHVVAAHKGRIWAENLPDCGCAFSFTLPAASS